MKFRATIAQEVVADVSIEASNIGEAQNILNRLMGKNVEMINLIQNCGDEIKLIHSENNIIESVFDIEIICNE